MAHQSTISSQILDIAGLAIKDILRGLRHVFLYLRAVWLQVISFFPSFLRRPSKTVIRHVDQFAEQVERRTATVVHQYLDPDITRDSDMATFSKIILREDAPRLFAKTTYDNLKFIIAYLKPRFEMQEDVFISEMLSACAYRKANLDVHKNGDEFAQAASVLSQLMKHGSIRTNRSLNAYRSPNDEIQKFTEVAYFSHILWMIIARDYEPEREFHLVHACCDLSSVIHEQIREAGDDLDKLAKLLKLHARIV